MNDTTEFIRNCFGKVFDKADLHFLVAADKFLESLDQFTLVDSSRTANNWINNNLDLIQKVNKDPNFITILEDAAKLLCATNNEHQAAVKYLAKIAGVRHLRPHFEMAIKNKDPIAAREAFQKRALFLLRFEEFRALNNPMLTKLVSRACETCDAAFFVQLGRRLSKKPKSILDKEPEKIALILFTLWSDPKLSAYFRGLPDEQLLKLLQEKTGNKGLSFEAFQRARQRLGLKKQKFQSKASL